MPSNRPQRQAAKVARQKQQKLIKEKSDSSEEAASDSENDYDQKKDINKKTEKEESSSSSDDDKFESEEEVEPTDSDEETVILTTKSKANRKIYGNQRFNAPIRKNPISRKANVDSESEVEEAKPPQLNSSYLGNNLSDSSDCEDENDNESVEKDIQDLCDSGFLTEEIFDSSLNDSESSMIEIKQIHDNLQKMNRVKDQISKYAGTAKENEKRLHNIEDLLNMGEKSIGEKKSLSQKDLEDSDDSDHWQEVEAKNSNHQAPKHGVEILMNNSGAREEKAKKKPVSVEAQFMRKFNMNRKQHQEHLHKVELMCWMAHYAFVNKQLNNTDLIDLTLKLLPRNKKIFNRAVDEIELLHFIKITKWFRRNVLLNNIRMYDIYSRERISLVTSLSDQIKCSTAKCHRDYVLIFIIFLRTLGFQCRMVQSIVCDPKKCPKSELLPLNAKVSDVLKSDKFKGRFQSTVLPFKLPQLDGVDDELPKQQNKSNMQTTLDNWKKVKRPPLNQINNVFKIGNSSSFFGANQSSIFSHVSPKRPASNIVNDQVKRNKYSKSSSKFFRTQAHIFGPTNTSSSPQPSTSSFIFQHLSAANENLSSQNNAETIDLVSPPLKRKTITIPQSMTTNLRPLTSASYSRFKQKIPHVIDLINASPESESISETFHAKKRIKLFTENDFGYDELKVNQASNASQKVEANPPMTIATQNSIKRQNAVNYYYDKLLTPEVKHSQGIDIWVEVYSQDDCKWISIDVNRGMVKCNDRISKQATKPMAYVFAWNNDNSAKDVTARYCKDLNSTIKTMRVERDYLNRILNVYTGKKNEFDVKEDEELHQLQLSMSLPKYFKEYKNHPLYAVKRHLLKFEAIYPPEPPILGYIQNEAVYPRDCIFTLHTRETWVKEARVVKQNEEPYKISKITKRDRNTNKLMKDLPLELFGIWQTNEYEPPSALNGIIPRNGYGNVELFKPCMKPKGTVHMKLDGLDKVCKKLNIDCVQAVVAFGTSSGGWSRPVFDGFVVCEEFQDQVRKAWKCEQEEIEKKTREKEKKRVLGNWRRIIKGLWIRERLLRKYNLNTQIQAM